MATPQDVLLRAHDLLGEFGWTRGAYSIDGNGEPCGQLDPDARAFCAVGAITRAATELQTDASPALEKLTYFINNQGDGVSITAWNDVFAPDAEYVRITLRKAAGAEIVDEYADDLRALAAA